MELYLQQLIGVIKLYQFYNYYKVLDKGEDLIDNGK